MNIEILRALVRPTVTLGLVLAQIALAFMWALAVLGWLAEASPMDVFAPFAALAPFTMFALTYWFKERDDVEVLPLIEDGS